MKRKLGAWRVQKCIDLVGADTVTYHCVAANYPVSWGGGIAPRIEICGTSGLLIPMVLRLHQSNGYIKRKLRALRVQKCIALVGADTVLIRAWPQTTPFHGVLIGS